MNEREWRWDLDNSGWWYFQSVKASAEGLVWCAHYPHEKDSSEMRYTFEQTREEFLQQGPPIPMVIPEEMLVDLVNHLGAVDAPWWRAHHPQGERMLRLAAEGNEAGVRELLDAGVDVNYKDIKGRTALYFALKGGAMTLSLALLDKGAQVNLRYPRPGTRDAQPLEEGKVTALGLAATTKSHQPVMLRLIALGADVNAEDDSRKNPIQQINLYDKKSTEVLQRALEAGLKLSGWVGVGLLEDALRASNREAAELLLGAGVDGTKGSILHYAVRYPDLVQRLIGLGADVNAKDLHAQPPLFSAIRWKAPLETFRLLLAAGANPKEKDPNGETAMILAAGMGSPSEVLTLLLDAGAELNVQNKSETTPLLSALVMSKFETALFLLERGADPKASAGKLSVAYFLSKEKPKEASSALWERLVAFLPH